MRHTFSLLLITMLALPAIAADDAPTPAQQKAAQFQSSLFAPPDANGYLKPLPEAQQRQLFEAFVETLNTREDKSAFLTEISQYRYVYAINPVVAADYAAPLLKEADAELRLAAINA